MKTKEITNLNTPILGNAYGTSYHDTSIDATVKQLKSVLGEPTFSQNDGNDKVNFQWVRENMSGQIFTVYDYKEYRKLKQNEIINWHIGGMDGSVTNQALVEIERALRNVFNPHHLNR